MKLHLTSGCIIIYASENSSHYLHVSRVLSKTLGRALWLNETLVNFTTQEDSKKRKAFLSSLYYTCAFTSKTHNAFFLERLLLASHMPIKLIKKQPKQRFQYTYNIFKNPYILLNANENESLQSIRKKYLLLAKTFHPDKLTSQNENLIKNCTEKFQQIQEAYAMIKAEKMKKIAA